jgi:hypothetical protein
VEIRSLTWRIGGLLRRVWARCDGHAEDAERSAPALLGTRSEAEVCARKLLLRVLTPGQREDYELHGYFAVQVARRGRFWILPSTFFNVLHAETGNCYCAVPRGEIPLSDVMLAQKLLLENNAEAFFAVANRRVELIPGVLDDRLLPARVMQARGNPPRSRVRWSEVSMIP